MISKHIAVSKGPDKLYGLDIMAHFSTSRKSFHAHERFTLVLDETDFGHTTGEVEVMAEDPEKAQKGIDGFLSSYLHLFDCSRPVDKLTTYFKKFSPTKQH